MVANLMCLETRMWTFAFFSKNIHPQNYKGEQHFSYHQKDGVQSTLLGFIMVIAFEIPIMHLVLHFVWSPLAANIISLLTLFSMVFFIAEYRAFARRPISIFKKTLIIRYGIFPAYEIDFKNINSITLYKESVPRSKSIKRYNYFGDPNIEIIFNKPKGKVEKVYLGLDSPKLMIDAIDAYKENNKNKKSHN